MSKAEGHESRTSEYQDEQSLRVRGCETISVGSVNDR
jgi:hypothetical protein